MPIVSNGGQTLHLPAGHTLTVVATAVTGAGSVTRLNDSAGGEPGSPTAITAGQTRVFGPHAGPSRYLVEATGPSLDYAIAATDFPAPSEVTAAAITTAGDLIIGGAGGVPVRLAAGEDGQVLKMVSGAPAWANP